ncbi:aspartate:alanine exchanger family transporter [Persicobacter psychrovividus]|uniref:Transporter n=1 Tax=Persicobacter psychrovividus TaxID=387638 RepID=A0ABM7VKR6_9BACT|nr:putative transporter [Persicobacter psychrovividus]
MDFSHLFEIDYFILFLVIAIGMLLGRIKIKGVSFDASMVIFVALFFGHLGYSIPPIFKTIGLILFILTIGIQAGPAFFDSFRTQGSKLIIVAVTIVLSGGLTALGCAYLFDIDLAMAVGLFTGALTSTPGLAAAIEATKGAGEASIGYGIAYPFGVIGVILFCRLSPKFFRINIKEEEEKYYEDAKSNYPSMLNKNYIVDNEQVFGKRIGDLLFNRMTGANISRVMSEGHSMVADKNYRLKKGDIIKAVGTDDSLDKVEMLIGPTTVVEIPKSEDFDAHWFTVTNRKIINKELQSLALLENYNARITRIRRSGVDMTPNYRSRLKFGDRVMVVSGTSNTAAVSRLIGNDNKSLTVGDFFPVAAIAVIGILLGNIHFGNFSLGLTGGVLITALLLSWVGKTGPILWNIAGPANAFLREIGLLFFLAAVGTSAGSSLVATIEANGFSLFISGVMITMIPMILAITIGRILKINYLSLLGTLTGGMTSTPGLSAVDGMTETNAPSVAYATVYPFAMVILVIVAQIMGHLYELATTGAAF